MTIPEFIQKWNVAFESKEEETEFAAEMEADIKSLISSRPEPPKYQPKQGEAVIFRDRKDCPWSASVATGIYWRIYYYGDTLDVFEVLPFDASLVGKVTND